MHNTNNELQPSRQDLSKRLGHVENTLASITSTMEAIGRNVDKLSDAVSILNNNNKTNWSTLAAWASVLMMIGGVYQYMASKPNEISIQYHERFINRNMQEIDRLRNDMFDLRERINDSNTNPISGGDNPS